MSSKSPRKRKQKSNGETKNGKRAKKKLEITTTIEGLSRRFGSAAEITAPLAPFLIKDLIPMIMDYVAPWHVVGECVGRLSHSVPGSDSDSAMACAGKGELVMSGEGGISVLWPAGTSTWIPVIARDPSEELAAWEDCIFFVDSDSKLVKYNINNASCLFSNLLFPYYVDIRVNQSYVFVQDIADQKTVVLDRDTLEFTDPFVFQSERMIDRVALSEDILYLLAEGFLCTADAGNGEVIEIWDEPAEPDLTNGDDHRLLVVGEDVLLYTQGSKQVWVFSAREGECKQKWELDHPVTGGLAYNGMFVFARHKDEVLVYK